MVRNALFWLLECFPWNWNRFSSVSYFSFALNSSFSLELEPWFNQFRVHFLAHFGFCPGCFCGLGSLGTSQRVQELPVDLRNSPHIPRAPRKSNMIPGNTGRVLPVPEGRRHRREGDGRDRQGQVEAGISPAGEKIKSLFGVLLKSIRPAGF